MKCKNCKKEIEVFSEDWYMFSDKCKSCYLNEIEKQEESKRDKKEAKAIREIIRYIKDSDNSKEPSLDWHQKDQYGEEHLPARPIGYSKLSKSKQKTFYLNKEDVINSVIKNNGDVKNAINFLIEKELIKTEEDKILERQQKRKIREEAEKKIYGKIKNKRKFLTEEEKDMVFDKFNNECAVCGKKEGLHIHHKDEDSSNNQIDNLVVLCGVCHKKTHMKIR